MNGKYDDKFWDLSSSVERRAQTGEPAKNGTERTVSLTGINDSFVPRPRPDAYRPQAIGNTATNAPVAEYEPESKPFILKISLSSVSGRSASDFKACAQKSVLSKGYEVPFEEFYAPTPVYRNLNGRSWRYYLWWRDSFLAGECIKTNWSYISLYLSELINCDCDDAERRAEIMWRLFEAYSDSSSPLYVFDALTKLPEIICDYSVIHKAPIPASVSAAVIRRAAQNARFKEFFLDASHPAGTVMLLTSLCSEYDYEKSKFASQITVNNAMGYIFGAVKYSIDKAVNEGYEHPFSGVFRELTTITRYAYSSYVFVLPEYVKIIKSELCSVNRSFTLRNTVTGIVKQCENRLRAHSGIKARLHAFVLEPFFRDAVEEYLDAALPKVKPKMQEKKTAPEPEYERLYERASTGFSLDNAKLIEERSWSVTERLLDGIEADSEANEASAEQKNIDTAENKAEFEAKDYIEPQKTAENESCAVCDELSDIFSAIGELKAFLLALYKKDHAAMLDESDKLGIPISLMTDRINEAAFDVMGDTLIEESDGGFEIIADYEWLFEGIEK
jgi:hypothetical protein